MAGHAIFECNQAKRVWAGLNLKLLEVQPRITNMGQLICEWKENVDEEEFAVALTCAWQVWTTRNDHMFNGNNIPPAITQQRAIRHVQEQWAIEEKENRPPRNGCNHPVVKINVDASLSEEGWIGMGSVIRDNQGNVEVAATRRARARWSPRVAEGRAALFGLQVARQFGYMEIQLESDCLTLIQRVSKPKLLFSDFDMVLDDILSLSICLL